MLVVIPDALQARLAAELRVTDPDGAARVLVAIVQGSVVQRDLYGDDFDPERFRAAALALVSQPGRASRQRG